MKKKRTFFLSLISCLIFINIQVSAESFEYIFEYYVTLQIDNNNYVQRYGLEPASIRQIDENNSSIKPFIYNGSTMLPVRALINMLPICGPPTYDVAWHDSEGKVTILGKDSFGIAVIIAEFWIGSNTAVFYDRDGKNPWRVTIPNAPMIVGDRTFIPIRAVVDALHNRYEIEWIPSKQGIVIFWPSAAPRNVLFPDGSIFTFSDIT